MLRVNPSTNVGVFPCDAVFRRHGRQSAAILSSIRDNETKTPGFCPAFPFAA